MIFALHTGTIRRARAALMILPVVIYLLAVFFVPIGGILGLAVRDQHHRARPEGRVCRGQRLDKRLPALDPAWRQPAVCMAIDRAAGPDSDFLVLAALDLRRGAAGSLHFAPDESRLYLDVLARTLKIAAAVTAIWLILALPAAYLLKSVGAGAQGLLMIVLLLPL